MNTTELIDIARGCGATVAFVAGTNEHVAAFWPDHLDAFYRHAQNDAFIQAAAVCRQRAFFCSEGMINGDDPSAALLECAKQLEKYAGKP